MAMTMAGTKLQIRPSQRIGGVVGREGFLVLDQLGICMHISRGIFIPCFVVLFTHENPDVYFTERHFN